MKRLIIVYSQYSTLFAEANIKVIAESRKLKGWMVAKFEVKELSDYKETLRNLARIIRKGDLVLAAGGDGLATMAMNAVIQSGVIATLAVMPFGNFNDFASTLGRMDFETIIRKFEEGRYEEFYPLEVRVNDRHYTYSGVYFTVGMMAEAAEVLEDLKVRKKLTRAKNRMKYSAKKLFRWYRKNKHRKDLLPEAMRLNDTKVMKYTTDYVAMNGASLAGVVPGGTWYKDAEKFWSGTMRNRSIVRMFRKFVKALEGELPGKESRRDVLTFDKPSGVFVCAEGDGYKLDDVSKIEIKKSDKSLRVIQNN
ncbi:hypothetical protein IK146_02325 [Candidatus Saccharibacteria bacterium]|nr:hypothetical protein [Candidatus Saccharibacteria bacterium]